MLGRTILKYPWLKLSSLLHPFKDNKEEFVIYVVIILLLLRTTMRGAS